MHEQRQARLNQFVEWTGQHIRGDEKGEAQLFLDRFLQAFGQKGLLETGGKAEFRIKKASEDGGRTSFADYVWKPIVLVEMKKRGADLARHYRQAFDYWVRLVPNRPRYVVLCNFDRFDIYDFNDQIDSPKDSIELSKLPSQYEALAFLFPTGEAPRFQNDRVAVTRQAADRLAECYNKLTVRNVPEGLRRRFILQTLVALFSEDIGLLPRSLVSSLLDECVKPGDTYDRIGDLFAAMNDPTPRTGGRFKGVRYFNGGLFSEPARLELYEDELNLLKGAATENWAKVSPDIFGTLFEHSLGKEQRHAFGAHYTSPTDIMKIVKPTIVDPWMAAIDSAKTLTRLDELHSRLLSFRVLDPACGSGNFLYLAYRELKRIEAHLLERKSQYVSTAPHQLQLASVTARQFFGLDVNRFAIELAKVTMMIARKLAIDELHVVESALPLDNLDENFLCRDALIDDAGNMQQWPPADVIIGNPPFLGAKRLKPERGADYVNRLRKLYEDVPGMADYCVYWLRRTHDHLPPCTPSDPLAGRAGLVGTQNIRNNQSRVGGLDHVATTGTIVEAVDNQPWSGEANVHVSIVNWIKSQDEKVVPKERKLWREVRSAVLKKKRRAPGKGSASKDYELSSTLVSRISASLSDGVDVSAAKRIRGNRDPQRVFQGVTPGYAGFVLRPDEYRALLVGEPTARDLMRPYLIGREIVSGNGRPQRFLIDGEDHDMLSLAAFPKTLKRLRQTVLPKVEEKLQEEKDKKSDMVQARADHVERWWTFWARRIELRAWMSRHERIIAGSRTQRIPFVFTYISTSILPGDKLQLFAFDDDYSFGVIQSSPHCAWYAAKAARLKNEADYNYSSDSVFDTFPWPQSPTRKQIDAVAVAGVAVRKVRAEALAKITGGLRAVYRTLEVPGKNPLKDAHADLDAAVLAAYGFDAKSDLLRQLLDLNHAVAAKEKAGEAVTAPGVPPCYGDPAALVSEDCIEP